MDWRPIVVLAHVLAAFWWFAGYVGTNVCTELARRSTSDEDCRVALAISDRIDVLANRTGGTAAGLTGLLAMVVFGYPITTPWVLAAIVLFAFVVFGGIFFWGRFGGQVGKAAEAGDWPGVRRALSEPRIQVYGRLENVAAVAIIGLMVLKPGS
jgi:uncharacterized membrane protein